MAKPSVSLTLITTMVSVFEIISAFRRILVLRGIARYLVSERAIARPACIIRALHDTLTIRHLDYTSARLRRAVKVSSYFTYLFTSLTAEKTAVFARFRLRNTAVFSAAVFVLFDVFLRQIAPCTHSVLVLFFLVFFLAFYSRSFFFFAVILYVSLPFKHIIPYCVLKHII